jgi:hypothetical protein
MMAAILGLLIALALVALRPPLFLYWAGGLGVGLLFQFLRRRYISNRQRSRPAPGIGEQSRGLSLSEILIVGVIVVVLGVLMFHGISNRIAGVIGFDVHYRAQITSADDRWNIEESLIVPGKELASMGASLLVTCGWDALGTAEANALFTRQRSQPMLTQLWPAYSVQVIHFPQPDCGQGFPLHPAIDSVAKLDVPKYFLIRTYPVASSRDEVLGRDREALDIPLKEFGDQDGGLRLEVLSPALRNRIGASLASVSVWAPLKWVGATLLLLFAEQIKRGVLEPLIWRSP